MRKFWFYTLGCLLLPIMGFAQDKEAKMVRIETIDIEAKVIGILEGHKTLAVLLVTQVDSSNSYRLEPQQEVLVEFVFGTGPSLDPKLAGIEKNDRIRAQIPGKLNPQTGQFDYRVYKYWPLSKEKPASPEAQPPQK